MGLLNGYGKVVSVTTSSQQIVLNSKSNADKVYYANQVSVFNNGSDVVYASMNISKAAFDVLDSGVPNNGTAIAIAAGQAFTFSGHGQPPIMNVCVVSASGTNEVYIGAA